MTLMEEMQTGTLEQGPSIQNDSTVVIGYFICQENVRTIEHLFEHGLLPINRVRIRNS